MDKYKGITKIEGYNQYKEVLKYIKEQTESGANAPELERLKSLCFDYKEDLDYKIKYKNASVLIPVEATHPSELVKDEMEARGETPTELAEKMEVSKNYINELLNGKKDITPTIAIKLESVWGIPAELWLRFQTQYEVDTARIKERNQLQRLTRTRTRTKAKATA